MANPYDPETVVLGVVGRPHGVRGELWFRPHNTQGASFAGLRQVTLVRAGARTTYDVTALKSVPDGAIVKLAGVDSREAAAALTLSEVRAPRSALPSLAPGEYYVNDVVGCSVFLQDGTPLGTVKGTFWNGAHDVMVIAGLEPSPKKSDSEKSEGDKGDGEKSEGDKGDDGERLIPLVPNFVVTVDAPGRKVIVSWDGHD